MPAQLDAVRVAPPGTTRARVPTIRAMAGTRSAGATTMIVAYACDASAAASDQSSTAWPPSSTVTLSMPARLELPAARIARPALIGRSVAHDPRAPHVGRLAARLGEDHPSTDRLEDAHDRDRQLVA